MTAFEDMSRSQLMDALRTGPAGIDNAERETENLNDKAIISVLRWRDTRLKQGSRIGGGLVVSNLRDGGVSGFDGGGPAQWARDKTTRLAFLDHHRIDEFWGEVAIISLVSEKKDPTPEAVRRYAHLAEKQQAEHDVACKEAADAQAERRIKDRNPLGTATGGMKKVDGLKAVQWT